jgi:predicted AlkP superfamily pyrophosphatase or phosphodiesterase
MMQTSTIVRVMRAALVATVIAPIVAGCGIAPAESESISGRRVMLVSVDGLRADALGHMPALSALQPRAQWTDSMFSIVPSLTVPGHLSMFSGRDVTGLGVTTNALDETTGLALMVNGATSVFQWVRSAGGRAVAIIGGQLVPQHQLAMAKAFFGLDELHAAPESTGAIVDQAITVATSAGAPDVLFVHISAVDAAGHSAGWVGTDGALTPQYVAAVTSVDAELARLIAAVEPSLASGDLAVAIAADHGGGHGDGCVAGMAASHEHCTAHTDDRRIPWLLVGQGVTPGRLAGRSSITQVAATLADLLRVDRPSRVGTRLGF